MGQAPAAVVPNYSQSAVSDVTNSCRLLCANFADTYFSKKHIKPRHSAGSHVNCIQAPIYVSYGG